MKRHLLPSRKTFYKASMHTHTTVSDGARTPEEIKEIYQNLGYSIVAYTDHEVLVPHPELTDENFVALTAYEVQVLEGGETLPSMRRCYHLNLYAKEQDRDTSAVFSMRYVWNDRMKSYVSEAAKKDDYVRVYSVDAVNDLIAKANADGFFVSYNHPLWSQQNYPDYAGLQGLWGIEVHNTGCLLGGYRETAQPFQDILREGTRIFPLCTDDTHSDRDCNGGWLMVAADKLDYASVVDALLKGDFYASTGPEIYEFSIDGTTAHISCSEAVAVSIVTERRTMRTARGTADAPITEATLDLSKVLNDSKTAPYTPRPPFIRLEVIDKYGKAAYSRPFFFSELTED